MNLDEAKDFFTSRWREMSLLDSTAAVLGWDEQVMMPHGGATWRASQFALLARMSHAIIVDPKLGDALRTVAGNGTDSAAAAQATEGLRRHERATRLSTELVAELAEVCWIHPLAFRRTSTRRERNCRAQVPGTPCSRTGRQLPY